MSNPTAVRTCWCSAKTDTANGPIWTSTASRTAAAKGVKTINITEKTGKLISIQAVTDDNDLMIINRSGLTIRTAVSQIRVAGRATQGVRIINLREGDAIASVMAVPGSEEEELAAVEGGENPAPAATDETSAAEQ